MLMLKRNRVCTLCFASLASFVLYYFVSIKTILNDRDTFQDKSQRLHGIHLITNYPLMTEKPWNENQTEKNESRLWQRQEELEETLQRNLNHSLIAAVHLLINQPLAERRLHKINLHNKDKLVAHHIMALPTYRDLFEYASDRLQNELVAVINMDIYLGEGFEKVNKTYLVQQNVTYVLTRHGRQEQRCNMYGKPGYCETGGYVGSHDAYVFVLTQRVDESVLSELEYEMNVYGAENVFIWVLKSRMNKKLLNPCRYLITYHNHCVNIHGAIRPRINTKRKSGLVPYSELYMS